MKVWRDLSSVNHLSKQVGGRKFGEFTTQPIMDNIKVPNWGIKVCRISSIRQICQTKVPPNFRLLWYVGFLLICSQIIDPGPIQNGGS